MKEHQYLIGINELPSIPKSFTLVGDAFWQGSLFSKQASLYLTGRDVSQQKSREIKRLLPLVSLASFAARLQ